MSKEPQSIIFDADEWTTDEARKWMKSHNYYPISRVDRTDGKNGGRLHYRLHNVKSNYKYRTKTIGDGTIKFVLGYSI